MAYGGDSPVNGVGDAVGALFRLFASPKECRLFYEGALGIRIIGNGFSTGAELAVQRIQGDFAKTNVASALLPLEPLLLSLTTLSCLMPLYAKYGLLSEASSMMTRVCAEKGRRKEKIACFAIAFAYAECVRSIWAWRRLLTRFPFYQQFLRIREGFSAKGLQQSAWT